MPIEVVRAKADPNTDRGPALPPCDTATEAETALLELLASEAEGAADTVLIRALGEPAEIVRDMALKAGVRMAKGAGLARAEALLEAFVRILDKPPADPKRAERVSGAVLELMGQLGEVLEPSQLANLLSRHVPLLGNESALIAGGAARGVASALTGALRSGRTSVDGEIKSLLDTSMQVVGSAQRPADSRAGAYGIGAYMGAAGATGLHHFGLMARLMSIVDAKAAKEARRCRVCTASHRVPTVAIARCVRFAALTAARHGL
jgi:hypothetical protein